MDNNFPPSLMPKTPAPDVFHILNNQLQILLVSTARLDDLAGQSQELRKQCSAIQMSARRIAELIGMLAKSNAGYPSLAAQQEWVRMQAILDKEKHEAEV